MKRRTSWERLQNGDGLKPKRTIESLAETSKREEVPGLRSLYEQAMNPADLNFDDNDATFVVRLYDGFDHCWCDCTGEVSALEALRTWSKKTKGGTEKVKFDNIDYYRIFPGGTRMLYDGSW
jgi:hypothetical protein